MTKQNNNDKAAVKARREAALARLEEQLNTGHYAAPNENLLIPTGEVARIEQEIADLKRKLGLK